MLQIKSLMRKIRSQWDIRHLRIKILGPVSKEYEKVFSSLMNRETSIVEFLDCEGKGANVIFLCGSINPQYFQIIKGELEKFQGPIVLVGCSAIESNLSLSKNCFMIPGEPPSLKSLQEGVKLLRESILNEASK